MKSEVILARHVCAILDAGVADLAPTVVERLRAGRERVLQQHQLVVESSGVAGSGGLALYWGEDEERHPLRSALVIFALLLGVLLAYYWNTYDQVTANEEIDSALLAGDLPPAAYLDNGFQLWLEKSSRVSE